MKLKHLLRLVEGLRLEGSDEITVKGVSHDSRSILPGMIFAALPGRNFHGADFLHEALDLGASVILSDRPRPDELDIPWLRSTDPRRHMAEIAWILSGDAPGKLKTIAVTGTNGKSTVVHLLGVILNQSGRPCTTIGTLGAALPSGERIPGERTTPESDELAVFFRRTVEEGGEAVAMEVSSHALEQARVHGLKFDVCVFTNLSRDHLDYHGDLEHYFQSKSRLFHEHCGETARWVLPIDDSYGRKLANIAPDKVLSWGESEGRISAEAIEMGLDGTRFRLNLDGAYIEVKISLIGRHNLRNALAASAAAHAQGLTPDEIARGLQAASTLPGRMELVAEKPCPVYVDYAHTPDALTTVLKTLSTITKRRILVVFGAGGNRDKGKRPLMGRAVAESGAFAILTSDNPRREDPSAIAKGVISGLRAGHGQWETILDRREAIARALEIAGDSDLVLIAGKGHENEQLVGSKRLPFSDRAVVHQLLKGSSICE